MLHGDLRQGRFRALGELTLEKIRLQGRNEIPDLLEANPFFDQTDRSIDCHRPGNPDSLLAFKLQRFRRKATATPSAESLVRWLRGLPADGFVTDLDHALYK